MGTFEGPRSTVEAIVCVEHKFSRGRGTTRCGIKEGEKEREKPFPPPLLGDTRVCLFIRRVSPLPRDVTGGVTGSRLALEERWSGRDRPGFAGSSLKGSGEGRWTRFFCTHPCRTSCSRVPSRGLPLLPVLCLPRRLPLSTGVEVRFRSVVPGRGVPTRAGLWRRRGGDGRGSRSRSVGVESTRGLRYCPMSTTGRSHRVSAVSTSVDVRRPHLVRQSPPSRYRKLLVRVEVL